MTLVQCLQRTAGPGLFIRRFVGIDPDRMFYTSCPPR